MAPFKNSFCKNIAILISRYGVVLRKLDLTSDAVEVLQEAIVKEPLHWGAWLELAALVTDKDMVCYLHYFLMFSFIAFSVLVYNIEI